MPILAIMIQLDIILPIVLIIIMYIHRRRQQKGPEVREDRGKRGPEALEFKSRGGRSLESSDLFCC